MAPWGCTVLSLLLFLLIPAEASFHPTKPTANTTYITGQAGQVTWVEDGTPPLLSNVGKMKIDLYAGNNTFLATLAKGVDPLSLSTTIFIPPTIPAHYYLYNLRFRAAYPVTSSVSSRPLSRPRLRAPGIVVYTADFSITPNPLFVQSIHTSASRKPTQTSHPTISSFPQNTSALPSVMIPTPASRLASSPTTGTAEKGKSGAVGRGLRGRTVMEDAGVMWMEIGVKGLMGLDGSVHGWNSEEMKFRLAFIVWPALIGLSMAV